MVVFEYRPIPKSTKRTAFCLTRDAAHIHQQILGFVLSTHQRQTLPNPHLWMLWKRYRQTVYQSPKNPTKTGWWFGICFIFHKIYGMSSQDPIDFHSHVSRWAHCTSNQKNCQGQLGESLQHHQDLLGELDRDEGTGYGSGPALPPLKIRAAPGAAIRKPPKPPALGRRIREEAETMEEQQEEATFFVWPNMCCFNVFF